MFSLLFSRRDCLKSILVLLYMFGEVFRENIWAWRFFLWEIFNYKFNFFDGCLSPLSVVKSLVVHSLICSFFFLFFLFLFFTLFCVRGQSRHRFSLLRFKGGGPCVASPHSFWMPVTRVPSGCLCPWHRDLTNGRFQTIQDFSKSQRFS